MERQQYNTGNLRQRKGGMGFVNPAYNIDKEEESSGWSNDDTPEKSAYSYSATENRNRRVDRMFEGLKSKGFPGAALRVKDVLNFKRREDYKRLLDNAECKDKDV